MSYEIDKDLCDVCGTCASVCPVPAITIKEFEVKLDNTKCIDCKKCVRVCPAEAISSLLDVASRVPTYPEECG